MCYCSEGVVHVEKQKLVSSAMCYRSEGAVRFSTTNAGFGCALPLFGRCGSCFETHGQVSKRAVHVRKVHSISAKLTKIESGTRCPCSEGTFHCSEDTLVHSIVRKVHSIVRKVRSVFGEAWSVFGKAWSVFGNTRSLFETHGLFSERHGLSSEAHAKNKIATSLKLPDRHDKPCPLTSLDR